MVLRQGDRGEDVKTLQRGLDRLGSMLLVDGDFGPATEAAVAEARESLRLAPGVEADDRLVDALAAVPEPAPEVTAAGVTFIGREEVSSPAAYRRQYRRPVWPSAESGITIGIGYDLRFVRDRAKLVVDWGDVLDARVIDRLLAVCGRAGSRERLDQVGDIEVPFLAATAVFLRRMIPEHAGRTRDTYPSLDTLPPHRRTTLISLVLNRGNRTHGEGREEMARIQELLAAGDLAPVAAQIESMTRLWNPVTLPGLIQRRLREARLWRDGFDALQLA